MRALNQRNYGTTWDNHAFLVGGFGLKSCATLRSEHARTPNHSSPEGHGTLQDLSCEGEPECIMWCACLRWHEGRIGLCDMLTCWSRAHLKLHCGDHRFMSFYFPLVNFTFWAPFQPTDLIPSVTSTRKCLGAFQNTCSCSSMLHQAPST